MKCKYCGETVRKGYAKGKEVILSYRFIPFSHNLDWLPHFCDFLKKDKYDAKAHEACCP